jgi:hypothetical protein
MARNMAGSSFPTRDAANAPISARETAANSNDCDTFFLHGRELLRKGRLISAACGHVK